MKSGDTELEILQALRNSGVDTKCGACMEVAFTGVTTNQHTCKANTIDQIKKELEWRLLDLDK